MPSVFLVRARQAINVADTIMRSSMILNQSSRLRYQKTCFADDIVVAIKSVRECVREIQVVANLLDDGLIFIHDVSSEAWIAVSMVSRASQNLVIHIPRQRRFLNASGTAFGDEVRSADDDVRPAPPADAATQYPYVETLINQSTI